MKMVVSVNSGVNSLLPERVSTISVRLPHSHPITGSRLESIGLRIRRAGPARKTLFLMFFIAVSVFGQHTTAPGSESAIHDRAQLPESLSLQDAIRLTVTDHPAYRALGATQLKAESSLLSGREFGNWKASLDLDARRTDKILIPGNDFVDDSRARFYLNKILTDFGRSKATVDAAQANLDSVKIANAYKKELHRIDTMQHFFNAHLSDLRFFVDDEDMTISFFRYDRARERTDRFGEFPLVRIKELEVRYRERFADRVRSENRRRSTRNALALAMGRPGQLVDNFLTPALAVYNREIPDYDDLLAELLALHPLLNVNAALIQSAEQRVVAANKYGSPELGVRFEASEYNRVSTNRDKYLAGLKLHVPFGNRHGRNSRIVAATAALDQIRSDRGLLEFEIRQKTLELVHRLEELEAERVAAVVNEEYRDLYLDRSRTLYELEVRSDLGDSEARQAEAVWRSTKLDYERALVWAKLDAMRGYPLAVLQNEAAQ